MDQMLATRFDNLHDICLARLKDCLDPSGRFLSRQIRDGAWGPTLGTESITSTAICLIGLTRAGMAPDDVIDDASGCCSRLAAMIREAKYPGGLGLVFWANSAMGNAAPLALLTEAGLDPDALVRVIPTLTTMEVAWMVSGLLHASHPALDRAGIAARQELKARLGPGTLAFRHASSAAPWQHRLRGRVANFADQIYPLQALAFTAIALKDAEALALADRCAGHAVAAQGPLGQWWWHHDATTGQVIEGYPVYSVHQHSMAPMALRALAVAGGKDHAPAVAKSRAWLQNNELGIDMIEPETGIIWRSIERDEQAFARHRRHARILLARPAREEVPARLRLNREIRPYEWGWLLYATSIESGTPPPGHIV